MTLPSFTRRRPVTAGTAWAAVLLVLSAGCAKQVPPVGQLAASRAAIEQAERSGAQEHAAVELLSARENLRRAEEAIGAEQFSAAQRFAEAAEADAALAEARGRTAQAHQAVADLEKAIASLRAEIQRKNRQ